jgi:hypothetical protein
LFLLNTEGAKSVANPIDLFGYLGISSPLSIANDGGSIAAAFPNVAVYEMVHHIEPFGKLNQWGSHSPLVEQDF